MIRIFLALVCVIIAFVVPLILKDKKVFSSDVPVDPDKPIIHKELNGLLGFIRWGFLLVALFFVFSTSFVIIGGDRVGHLKRIYFADPLPSGRVIALPNQKGPQAEILGPGFNFKLLLNVLYDVEELPVISIPDGHYGILIAKDGRSLRSDQYLADAWPEKEFDLMSNARFFMGDKVGEHQKTDQPRGQKGPQLSVLRPGDYRLNHYLFEVKLGKALRVEAGEVAVIKSNVQERQECNPVAIAGDDGVLSVPLVHKGCIGVWEEPLYPGTYYMNEMAYTWTKVSSRVQTWAYKGGYTRRHIDLDVDQDGNITQKPRSMDVPVPEDAADSAVTCRVEGWTVPQELRVLFQISPENAPFVVASVGGVGEAENKIVTPAVRSVVRTVIGRAVKGTREENKELSEMSEEERALALGTRVLDLVEKRTNLENLMENELKPEVWKARITVKDIRLAEPVIPPELLVAKLRAQLADQLIAAYKREKRAQEERKDVKRAQAEADKQDQLVQAEIDVNVSEKRKKELKNQGEGEKLRLIEIAAGQKAQVAVLGEARVMYLETIKELLKAAVENPEIVKVPQTYVGGNDSDSLVGAAAVLGQSNLGQVLGNVQAQTGN
ncbi:MAG: SPFH domain-containing protein [Thermodesulfobacteriota bacterium]|nr:SPFH domain-containing protein [Thermodesulfobacteriota bacterium]